MAIQESNWQLISSFTFNKGIYVVVFIIKHYISYLTILKTFNCSAPARANMCRTVRKMSDLVIVWYDVIGAGFILTEIDQHYVYKWIYIQYYIYIYIHIYIQIHIYIYVYIYRQIYIYIQIYTYIIIYIIIYTYVCDPLWLKHFDVAYQMMNHDSNQHSEVNYFTSSHC